MVKTLHFQCRVQSLVGGTRIPHGVAKTQIPCTRENGHQMRSLREAPFHVKGQSIRAPGIGKTQTAHSDIPDCLSFVSALHFFEKMVQNCCSQELSGQCQTQYLFGYKTSDQPQAHF